MDRRGSVRPLDSEQSPTRLSPGPMIVMALVALGLTTWALTNGGRESPTTTATSSPNTASDLAASAESTTSIGATPVETSRFGLVEEGRWVLPHLDGGPDVDSADFPDPTLVVVVSPGCSTCLGTAAAAQRAAEWLRITRVVLLVTNVDAGEEALDTVRIWNESLGFDQVAVDVPTDRGWARSDIMPDAVPLIGLWQGQGWGTLLTDAAGARADVIRWRLETGGAFHPGGEQRPWVPTGWEIHAAPWESPPWRAVTGVVGSSLVIWGGTTDPFDDTGVSRRDGWVWDGEDWSAMAESPLCPLVTPGSLVVGEELFIWGRAASGSEDCAQQAAYRPGADTWRALDLELLRRAGRSTPLTRVGDLLVAPTIGRAYDLAGQIDVEVPATPVLAGTHTLVAVVSDGERVLTLGTGAIHAWAPGDAEWQRLGPPGIGSTARAMALAPGHGVAVTYDMEAAAFDPVSGTWEPLPRVPLRFYECVPQMGAVAGHVVVRMCSGYAVWDTERSMWVPMIPSGVEGGLAFGHGGVYEIGARDIRHLAIVDDAGGLTSPPTVPLGVFFLDAGEWALTSVEVTPDGPNDLFLHVGSFTFERDGAACDVHAFHGQPQGARDAYFTEIRASRTGTDFPGLVDWSNGRILVGSRVGSDWLEIACDDPPIAFELAEQLWSPWE